MIARQRPTAEVVWREEGAPVLPRTIRIDWETPVVPRAIAERVCEEAGVWLQEPLPDRWAEDLVARAETVYANNARIRRKIRGGGTIGRDYLWMFMRHWLAARIQDHDPRLFTRLPASYCVGVALPGSPG